MWSANCRPFTSEKTNTTLVFPVVPDEYKIDVVSNGKTKTSIFTSENSDLFDRSTRIVD
ncbi:hypothetical protein Hdeb2414_s0204g00831801 [Helianthus debilis subsp. tardiflorus]